MFIFALSGSSSYAEVNVTSPGEEIQIPIQTKKSFKFQIPEFSRKKKIVLELDARVQRGGVDGYSPPAKITLNGKVIGCPRLINKPLTFKTAVGGVSSWCRTKYGDISTSQWVLYYAESFEIIGKEASWNRYRPIGVSGSHFAFDISDIAKEENILTIENLYTERIQKIMKAEVPIVVANIKLTFPEKIVKPEQSISPFSYAMPSYVVPRKRWKANYKFSLDKKGGVVVTVGNNSFPFTTYFSYPNGGWNTFPTQNKETEESDWQVTTTGTEKEYRIKGEGNFYKVTRLMKLRDDRIDVFDTILNKSKKEDLGIIVKHQIELSGVKVEKFFWGGGEVLLRKGSGGSRENPTFYLATSDKGLGLVAVDDVFRVQHQSYIEKGKHGGLKDDQFALPPNGKYTMEWSIYPTSDPSYFTFINAIRRDWGLNSFLAPGCQALISWGLKVDKFPSISSALPEKSRARRPEVKYVMLPVPCVFPNAPSSKSYIPQYGYPMLQLSEETVKKYKKLIKGVKKELGPEIKVLGYYGPPTFSVGKESISLFKKCWITLPSGKQAGGEGGSSCYPLFFPTKTNAFGKMVTKVVDNWLDWGADGIYFDYLDPSTCKTSYTYNVWDGHTAEIDPETKTIKRKFASIDLLSCRFLASLIKRIEKRGGVVLANRGMTTKTMTEATKNIPRLGEAGSISQLLRAHLTPCPAGLQRTHLRDTHSQLLGALDYGILTYPYDKTYSFPDNPITKIYPIKVRELHQGYVIGERKIVTKRSSLFGWGDKSKIVCYLYDKEGHPVKNDFPIVIKDGKTFMKIEFLPGQVAIVEKE